MLVEMTSGTALAMQEIEASVRELGGFSSGRASQRGNPGCCAGHVDNHGWRRRSIARALPPLLQAMGTRIVHVGKVGQGKVVKIVNQMMAAIHLLTIGEAFALGIKNGADPAILYEVIKSSSGYSKMMDLRLPGFLMQGSFQPGFKLDLMKKDVNLALESAKALGVPVLLTSAAAQVFTAASAAGKGSEDFSAAAQFLAALACVDLSHNKTEAA